MAGIGRLVCRLAGLYVVVLIGLNGCSAAAPVADLREYCAIQGGAWSEPDHRCRALSSSASSGDSATAAQAVAVPLLTPIKIAMLVDPHAPGFDAKAHANDRAECHSYVAMKEHQWDPSPAQSVAIGVIDSAVISVMSGSTMVYSAPDDMTSNYSRHKAVRRCMQKRGYTLLEKSPFSIFSAD